MPWQTRTIMSLKQEFIERCLRGDASISSLCRAYGISRNTAYRLLKRYEEQGAAGLVDQRSCRPVRQKHFADESWKMLRQLRTRHPTYGPRKLAQMMKNLCPQQRQPSASLIKKYLREQGLSKPRVIRNRLRSERLPLRDFTGPNSIWCMDFKGWFTTLDGRRCEPFTLIDGYSRYFLACTPLWPIGFAQVKKALEKAFCTYGMPEAIRSDNGPPFGSYGLRSLSPLSVWLLKQGIWPDKTRLGCPGENGRLERAHRTLKDDLLSQGKHNYSEYSNLFEEFMNTYNNIRPHECLSDQPPSRFYHPSPRRYEPNQICDYRYPPDYTIQRLTSKGYLRINGESLYLTESLACEYVGIGPETEFGHPILFLGYPLGFVEQHLSQQRK